MVEGLTVKKAFFFVLILSLAADFSFAKNPGPSSGPDGLDALKKQKGLFKTTLINPNAVFSYYTKISPKRVLLRFRRPGAAPDESTAGSMVRKRGRGSAAPVGEDLETFRQIITDAFTADLGSCEFFELVEGGGPETLFVRVTVTDIVTDVASKSEKGGENPKPFSVQGDISFDLIDAETGVVQARFGERRQSRKGGDSAAPPEAGKQWMNSWTWAERATEDFHQELERLLNEDRG
jgi:hypothetical protein